MTVFIPPATRKLEGGPPCSSMRVVAYYPILRGVSRAVAASGKVPSVKGARLPSSK